MRIAWLSSPSADSVKSKYLTKEILPLLGDEFQPELFSSPMEIPADFVGLPVAIIEDTSSGWALAEALGSLSVLPVIWWLDVYRRGQTEESARETLRKISLRSRAAIFSSERLLGEFRRLVLDAMPPEGLFQINVPVALADASLMSLPRERNKIVFAGGPETECRAHKLLEAMGDFPHLKLCWLINADEQSAVDSLLAEFPNVSCEKIIGRAPDTWRAMHRDAFVAVHTLVSAFSGLGPYFPISAAEGVPLIVSDFSEGAMLPPALAQKVAPGRNEVEDLKAALLKLLDVGTWKVESQRSYDFAAQNHDRRQVAAEARWLFGQLGRVWLQTAA